MNSLNKMAFLSVLALSLCSGTVFSMDIFGAAEYGDLARVQELIGQDQSVVNQQDEDGKTPLHMAARRGGHTGVVQVLIAARADVNAQGLSGRTPLHWAAHYGRADVAQQLITAGADPSIVARDGNYPLSIAIARGHDEIANMVFDAMEEIRTRRMREIASALASATQPRLGADSPAALLSQDLMAYIVRSAV
jgi:ankyrin repeat protein